MHSCIIQLETDKHQLDCNYLDENTIIHEESWFLGEIADYVSEFNGDHRDEVQDALPGMVYDTPKIDDDGDYLMVVDAKAREKYLMGLYETIIGAAKRLATLSYDEYKKGGDSLIWQINDAHKDKFGMYIYSAEWGLIPYTSWIKRNDDPKVTYYIGGILDYHF